MTEKTIRGVVGSVNDHPWVQVIVTVCALAGTLGGGGAFFKYLGDKEVASMEAKKIERATLRAQLEASMEITDLRSQLAAGVLVLAEQGKQIRALRDAVAALAVGERKEAREGLSGITIPSTQGQPILGGRAIDMPESYEGKKALIRAKLKDLE